MIKRIDTDHSWNWVDNNNRMVGFDNHDQCCEDFGFKFFNIEVKEIEITEKELGDFEFTGKYTAEADGVDFEYTNTIDFQMKDIDGNYLWLQLYNAHNGYYSHGFKFKKDDEIITEGEL